MIEIITLILLILIVFLFLAILFVFFLYIFDIFLPAPYVATKSEVVEKMVKVAQIKQGDRVLDLGSGDGRLIIEAAKLGAEATGIEKNPSLVLFSKIKAKIARVKVKILWGDITNYDLQNSDIIFLYLNAKMLSKLAPKIAKEAKKGTKIVSNTYEIPNFEYVGKFDNVFLYKL